jgi:NADPH2:quinone reductase
VRAVVIEEYGGPEVVQLREWPEPEPGPGEVSVDVRFASMNFTDVRNRRGDGLGRVPFVPGVEVSGRVRRLGEGVRGLEVGQPVAALTRGQAHAEVATASSVLTVAITDALAARPESGAMLVTVPVALVLLRDVTRATPEDVLLVHSAAGGVGTVVGQLAARRGLEPPFGTVGDAGKAAFARAHGYGEVCTYDAFADAVLAATGGRGVDVVLDPVGGAVRAQSFQLLAPLGRLATYSNISREPEVAPEGEWLRARCVSYAGLSVGQLTARAPETIRPVLEEAVELVRSGHVDVGLRDVLPIAQAERVHRMFEERRMSGKVVFAVG